MAKLSIQEAYNIAVEQGFTGNSAISIVAIGIAESGLDTDAKGYNKADQYTPVDSIDRGILQINDYWHSEVSDDQAYHAPSAFAAAYRISDQGNNFSPWATFNTPRYEDAIKQVKQAIGLVESEVTVSIEVPEQWIHDVSKATGVADPLAVTPEPTAKSYTVQTGDSLYAITQAFTGDGNRWRELYDANLQIIGQDPNVIYPGQVLTLPSGW